MCVLVNFAMFDLHLCNMKSSFGITTFSSWSNCMQKPHIPQWSQCCPYNTAYQQLVSDEDENSASKVGAR